MEQVVLYSYFRIAAVALAAMPAAAQDAVEIVRRSVSQDQRNWDLARQYTYLERIEERKPAAKGAAPVAETRTYDVSILYGQPYRRLVERNDKPLNATEERKEQEKFDRVMNERSREPAEKRQRRLREFENRRKREREFLRELPDAYDFRLLGEELVGGRPAWKIEATPKPGYRPRNSLARLLPKFRGTLWIDTSEHQWSRIESEAIDTVSWGLFLARLARGTRFSFEQVRVNDEIWLPRRLCADFEIRLGLVKKLTREIEVSYRNYRKFQSDSQVLATHEVP
jgi:hypothetical protein